MKKIIFYMAAAVILFVIGYKLAVGPKKAGITQRTRILMGTVVGIQVRNEEEESANSAINEAFDEIKKIDLLFSAYDSSGTVFSMNLSSDSVFIAEGDIKKVLEYSDSLWRLTGGAFDVSLHNLTVAWGFNIEPSYPGEEKILTAKNSSGWDKTDLKDSKFIKRKDIKLNFGAIAKGYAVDRAVEVLRRNGIEEALVDAGGEIKTIGGEWKVGVQDPSDSYEVIKVLKLDGMSVATSGDYENYFEYQGKRYHHILDPATGYPGDKCRSVTVIARDNYFADGLATGIFVMGPEKGIELAEGLKDTEVMIVDSRGKIQMSSGFKNYIVRY
jgi:thiamine biosynthesis lipoprotein